MSQQMGPMGGPVGGMPHLNVGTPTNGNAVMTHDMHIKRLNTAIYDYLLRNQHYGIAKDFVKEVPIETRVDHKRSPNQRNGQPNGVDDSMDPETKDPAILNRPDDLPLPAEFSGEGIFLQDWWLQFWEIYHGQRSRGARPPTIDYISQQRTAQKLRLGSMANMNPNAMQNNMRNYMAMNGAGPQDLRRGVLGNQQQQQQQQQRMTPQQAAQMKQMTPQQGQVPGGNLMERQGSTMDNSSASPIPGSEDPPSKRQRLENPMAQMGQPRPGQPGQMPGNNQAADYSASMQQQMKLAMNHASDLSKGIPQGNMLPNGQQGSPAGMDSAATKELYAAAAAANGGRLPMQNPAAVPGQAGQAGSHALQDYQMQLMLLEQQNKKRLLMARQEQDTMTHPGMPPNGMMDPNIRAQMMAQMGPNGQPLRQPGGQPNPMAAQMAAAQQAQHAELLRAQQGGQMMPNGTFPGPQGPQGMMPLQQPPPGGQAGQPMGTPRQQNTTMPPPPAPQNNAGGTQPSSPSSQPAPPTPNQAGKAKGKKNETKNAKAAGPKKGQGPNATPASEADHPPTPTPATPMTPMNAQSFNQNKQLPNGQAAGGLPGPQASNAQQKAGAVQASQPQQQAQPPMQPDMSSAPFGNLDPDSFGGMDMPFSSLEGGDVLDNFDFDSFLNDGNDGGLGFDAQFAFGDGGIETSGLDGAN